MQRTAASRALLTALGCAVVLSLLQGRPAAQGFDCAKAATRTEKMICGDVELSKLDAQLSERYKLLLSKAAADRSGVVAMQARWLAEQRNVATLAADLRQAYTARLADLNVAIACRTAADLDDAQLVRCAQISFGNRDAELAALYRKLLAGPNPLTDDKDAPAILKASQDAWSTFRDAECEREAVHLRGGTLHPMEVAGCAEMLTKDRIKQLTPEP